MKVFLPLVLVISFDCYKTKGDAIVLRAFRALYLSHFRFRRIRCGLYSERRIRARLLTSRPAEDFEQNNAPRRTSVAGWRLMHYGESQQIARDQNSRLRIRFPGIHPDEDICCSIYGHGISSLRAHGFDVTAIFASPRGRRLRG